MKFSNPNTQRGLSFWYFIWQVVFFICVSYILIIGIPPYLDNAKIQRALDSLVEERSVQTMSRAQIVKALNRKLNIDIADDIVQVAKVLKIKPVDGRKELRIDYEVVVPVVYNLSLLMDFENSALSQRQ